MKIEDLQNQQQFRVNNARSIQRLLETDVFILLYEACEDKKEILEAIEKSKKIDVEKWLKKQTKKNYSIMSLRELRILGRKKGISYYNRLSKSVLLAELMEFEQKSVT